MLQNLKDREKHNLCNIYYFRRIYWKSGWYGDDVIQMKCSKAKQNHIIHIFAEQSEAQKIDAYTIYMPSEARPKIFLGTISLKNNFAIIKFDI